MQQEQKTRLALNAAAWFFVGQSEGTTGAPKTVPIEAPFRIGRNPSSDLSLPCHSVSGLHAIIVEESQGLFLLDQDSTNGTFLNGNRIDSKCILKVGDTIQFGTTVFHVCKYADGDETPKIESYGDSAINPEESGDDLMRRLFDGGIVPFFQPIVQMDNEQNVIGYEVLGRSRLFGLRTPAQMFAAASRMEMEAELSRVLRKRGVDVADQNLPEEFSLFVNTHTAELEYRGLEDSLSQIRDDHPSRGIILEVDEAVLNEQMMLKALCDCLKNHNVQLAFHGFGGGQVNLSQLAEASPEVIKFDAKLIQGIDKAASKRQKFVGSLVRMVTDLGITPLAECIEEAGEFETLQQLGFKLGQGFHFGRPSSITDCLTKQPSNKVPMVKSFMNEAALPTVEEEVEAEVKSSGPRDAEWLLAQPEHYYTIQVLSAISQERANEHVAMQENPEQFAIFCKQGKTRILYIVVCGAFEDRAAAKAASAQLANVSVSPWIRMLSSVHAEIRSGQEK